MPSASGVGEDDEAETVEKVRVNGNAAVPVNGNGYHDEAKEPVKPKGRNPLDDRVGDEHGAGARGRAGRRGPLVHVFVEGAQLRESLTAIRLALTEEGHFLFETRNPLARGWESWTADNAVEIVRDGRPVRMVNAAETPVIDKLVSFTTTFTSPDWVRPQTSRSTLRFLNADSLSSFLSDAGLAIEEQFGDWDRQEFTDTSPEIITVARRTSAGSRQPRRRP